jgi:hypothetical protein
VSENPTDILIHVTGKAASIFLTALAIFVGATSMVRAQQGFNPENDPIADLPGINAFSAIESITPDDANLRQVHVDARLTDDAPTMQHGISWRVFSTIPDRDGKLPLVATAEGGSTDFELPPGEYFLNASFGRANATKKLVVPGTGKIGRQDLVLDAGGLLLKAVSGGGAPIPDSELTFSVYTTEVSADGERALVIADVGPNTVLRLNADTYHIVSKYGAMNAVIRADIQVPAGKLTEATLVHNAARVTFKLVSEPGGEAIADTAWSILTLSGDSLSEIVGAFPSMVLSEGSYVAIARNKNNIYQREFTVKAGHNGDVELLLKKHRAETTN